MTTATAFTLAEAKPGTTVNITYCGDFYVGPAVVEKVQHTIDAERYEIVVRLPEGTTIDCQPRDRVVVAVKWDGSSAYGSYGPDRIERA